MNVTLLFRSLACVSVVCAISSGADTAFAGPTARQIDIVISPAAIEAIRNAPAGSQKQFDAAFGVASKYLPLHYDGRAYSFDPGYDYWTPRVGHLLAMNGEQFERYILSLQPDDGESLVANEPPERLFPAKATARWVSCPRVRLVRASVAGDGTRLEFESQRIGYSVNRRFPRRFVAPENPGLDKLAITVGANGKITDLNPLIEPWGSTSDTYREARQGYVHLLRKSPRDIGGVGDSMEVRQETLIAAKRILNDMDAAAKRICGYPGATSQ